MKTYIQRRDGKRLETVDEFETRKEATAMLAEYRLSDPGARCAKTGATRTNDQSVRCI